MDTEFAYIEVDRWQVPVEHRLVAASARRLACRLMGVTPPPEIRWFRPARTERERLTARLATLRRESAALADTLTGRKSGRSAATVAAFARANGLVSSDRICGITYVREQGTWGAVWINAALPTPREVAMTVLHELRHAFQAKAGTWPHASGTTLADAEAESFAEVHVKEALRSFGA